MKAVFQHITLVYSFPKYVTVVLRCTCHCGTISTNILTYFQYGRIHVECKTCSDKAVLLLDRSSVTTYHLATFSHISGSLDAFMNGWEADMEALQKAKA